jgi:hypothetical protein
MISRKNIIHHKNKSMKKLIGIITLLTLVGASTVSAQDERVRTEEYAILDVFEYGKKKVIRITVGERPAREKEWKRQKTDIRGDMSPVMVELGKLNKRGFKLLNMSTTYTTVGGGQYTSQGTPRHTFIMVKSLE